MQEPAEGEDEGEGDVDGGQGDLQAAALDREVREVGLAAGSEWDVEAAGPAAEVAVEELAVLKEGGSVAGG